MDSRDTIKRQTRVVDNDRQKYQAAVKQQLQKQNETISLLKKNIEGLKQKVASTTGGTYRFTEQDATTALQQDVEALERKLNFEKMRQRDLEKKVAIARMDLSRARKGMNGVNVTQDNIMLVEKQVRVLENRLDQALVQFNESLAYNRELRQQIDNLRGERKVFTEIYRKLESDLHDKKKKMADIIERSNKDYEERDALKQQLETLRAAAKEDAKKYDDNFAKLDDMMIKYKQLKEQQQQQALQQQSQQSGQRSPTKQKLEDTRKEDTTRKKNTLQDTKLAIGDDLREEPNEEDDIDTAIEMLKEGTGIRQLDKLHQQYVKNEEQSFSLYNFVNELKTEEEKLQAEIAALQEQYEKQRGDTQRSAALKALENELAVTETQHEAIIARTAKARETLEASRAAAQDIFDRIQCSKVMAEELAGTTEVNEINLLTFLGIIEHRANELLFASNLSAAQEMRKRAVGKAEESRRQDKQKDADRQARRDAGDYVDDDDDDDNNDDAPIGELARARFIGVGPSMAHGALSAKALVAKEGGLPTTTVTDGNNGPDQQTDDGPKNPNQEEKICDHDEIRQKVEERLKAKRELAKKAKPKHGKGTR